MRSVWMMIFAAAVYGQTANSKKVPAPGEWPMYNHDVGSTRYSPLTQITPANVSKLAESWTFTTRVPAPPGAADEKGKQGKGGGRGGGGIGAQATPIVVNGVMYVPAGNLVVALEP